MYTCVPWKRYTRYTSVFIRRVHVYQETGMYLQNFTRLNLICKFLHTGGDMPWSKESRQSRGYGAEWAKRRREVIERAKGLCEECARNGRVAMGKDVDHITSRAEAKRLGWSEARTENIANLQYLCRPCHLAKSAKETGRAYREPRPATGLDGWPEEKG